MHLRVAAPILCLLAAGCSSPGSHPSPIIPADVIAVTSGPGGTVTAGAVLAAAAAYLVYDPLAPNWEIQEQALSDGLYQLNLQMKRYNTGGDGEPLAIVRRRASELQQAKGMGRYRIVSYQQSIESQTVGARRQAVALIRLDPISAPTAAVPPPDIVRTTFETPAVAEPKPVVVAKPTPKKSPKRPRKPSANGCNCKDQ